MAEPEFVVTEDSIIDEVEYTARPGTKYEISPGVTATLKHATEGVIEAFEAKRWTGEEDARPPRAAAVEQALEVLNFPDDNRVEKADVLSPVAGRARDDFFFMSQGKLSAQMKSFTEAAQAMRLEKDAESPPSEDSPAAQSLHSANGQSAGKTATASGSEEKTAS